MNVLEATLNKDIKDYLIKNIGVKGFNGEIFCAFELLGTEIENNTTNIYVWALIQEYYSDKGAIKEGTGSSLPIKLISKNEGSGLIIGHKFPRDGEYYNNDL